MAGSRSSGWPERMIPPNIPPFGGIRQPNTSAGRNPAIFRDTLSRFGQAVKFSPRIATGQKGRKAGLAVPVAARGGGQDFREARGRPLRGREKGERMSYSLNQKIFRMSHSLPLRTAVAEFGNDHGTGPNVGLVGRTVAGGDLRKLLPQNRDPNVGVEQINHSISRGGGSAGCG
jgi:hypothetical protein